MARFRDNPMSWLLRSLVGRNDWQRQYHERITSSARSQRERFGEGAGPYGSHTPGPFSAGRVHDLTAPAHLEVTCPKCRTPFPLPLPSGPG